MKVCGNEALTKEPEYQHPLLIKGHIYRWLLYRRCFVCTHHLRWAQVLEGVQEGEQAV